jgi:hypothetical protein
VSYYVIDTHSSLSNSSKMKQKKTQSLIFDRKRFRHRGLVKRWISENNYKLPKYKKQPIEKYANTYRVRIRPPYRFDKKTLRTVVKDEGVKAVKGFLK